MEMALTPMEFARRARRLYADREAVVGALPYLCNRPLSHTAAWCRGAPTPAVGTGLAAGDNCAGSRRSPTC